MKKNPHQNIQRATKLNVNARAIQAVIEELSRRNIKAAKHGRWEILIEEKIGGKVHAKRERYWPGLKGLKGLDLLILVDYSPLEPMFYI
jgi:hypothetical protein